jgi:thiol-disulfide isomerase/thioredoxin
VIDASLTIYGRPWCHLCDEMADAVAPIAARFGIRIEKVDVDSDPALEARFGLRIPVLAHGERELAEHRLDAAVLERYLLGLKEGYDPPATPC